MFPIQMRVEFTSLTKTQKGCVFVRRLLRKWRNVINAFPKSYRMK